MQAARYSLLRLEDNPPDGKNWRVCITYDNLDLRGVLIIASPLCLLSHLSTLQPQVLVLAKLDEQMDVAEDRMFSLVSNLKHGKVLLVVFHVDCAPDCSSTGACHCRVRRRG